MSVFKYNSQHYPKWFRCDCGGDGIVKFFEYNILKYCGKCSKHTILSNVYEPYSDKKCCSSPGMKDVQLQTSSGSIIHRLQCENCGYVDTKSLRMNGLKYPDIDTYKKDWRERVCTERLNELSTVNEFANNARYEKYNNYLNSEKWRKKRLIVLQRDNYVCQACLVSKATQVHHLDYRHLYNEPLFTLVSVCKDCHESIENQKKGLSFLEITHDK